jgi:hypothetical protein
LCYDGLEMIAHRERIWRIFVLGLLLLAVLGPWAYDPIFVPAANPCNAPFIRLEGDLCGTPLSGSYVLREIVSEFIERVGGILRGAPPPIDSGRDYIFTLFLGAFLIVLPLLNTLVLILIGNRRPWQFFNVAAWGLALGLSLLLGFTAYSKLHWELWGTWLYIGVAVIAVFVELLILNGTIHPSAISSP